MSDPALAAVLRVLAPAVQRAAFSAFSAPVGAGIASEPVRTDPRTPGRRRRRALDDGDVNRLTGILSDRVGPLLEAEFAGLAPHDRIAAASAVAEAIGPVDADLVFAADLDPGRLARAVRARSGAVMAPTELGEAGAALADRLLAETCAQLVEFVATRPEFERRAHVEQVRRFGDIARAVDSLATRPRSDTEDRYCQVVADALDRLELYGVTLSRSSEPYSMSTAYISLMVSGGPARTGAVDAARRPGMSTADVATARVERALAGQRRVLLRGVAGCGKTTLLQWVAVNAARRSFPAALDDWNHSVPFFLPLRRFVDRGRLPAPEEFLSAVGSVVAGDMPVTWVHGQLRSGRALVLVDGVDELPADMRVATRAWLRELTTAYPDARYVVTARPAAVADDWLARDGFATFEVLPMGRSDIEAFVAHWHDAVRQQCPPAEAAGLGRYQKALIDSISVQPQLGRLATNPLLCALLCALNRDRRMHLPQARKELYDAALEMLLVRRDRERDIRDPEGVSLSFTQSVLLLQSLAYWLIRNGLIDTDRAAAIEQVALGLAGMSRAVGTPDAVFDHLLLRSGLLREPTPGRVDFIHRTFQDHLGAKAAVDAHDIGLLLDRAHEDQWHDVVVMAAAHARPAERAGLLRGLLARGAAEPQHQHRLDLLAAAALDQAPELAPDVRAEVESATAALLPPTNMNQARAVAEAGEFVLALLPGPDRLAGREAAAVLRTAALMGSQAALAVIERFRHDPRALVRRELTAAWPAFDTEEYARRVLAGSDFIVVSDERQLSAVPLLRRVRNLELHGPFGDLSPVARLEYLDHLMLQQNPVVTSLGALAGRSEIRNVRLFDCPRLDSLRPLVERPLLMLVINRVSEHWSPAELAALPSCDGIFLYNHAPTDLPPVTGLRRLYVGWAPTEEVRLPALSSMAHLGEFGAYQAIGRAAVDDLAALPELRHLMLGYPWTPSELEPLAAVGRLKVLEFQNVSGWADLSVVPRVFPGVEVLILRGLRDGSVIDLAPLAELPDLRVEMDWLAVRNWKRLSRARLRLGRGVTRIED